MSDSTSLFLCGIIVGFLTAIPFWLALSNSRKPPPYAGKTGNEYLPKGVKSKGPIEKND